jgi:chromosomal replication initiator protein
MREPISTDIADRALEDLLPQPGSEIPAHAILDETASYFGLTRADLVSKNRSRPLTTARHVAMYLLRECTGLSLIKIGELFERDHTTVLHGVKKIEKQMGDRAPIFRQVQDLTRKVRSMAHGN